MKKQLFLTGLVFAVLLSASVLVFAQATDTTPPMPATTNTGEVAVAPAQVDEEGIPVVKAVPERPVIDRLHLFGKGLVVSPEDPMDFMTMNLIVGKVRLAPRASISDSNGDAETRCITPEGATEEKCFPVLSTGILVLDKEKYRLKNIDVVDESVTAILVKDGAEVGSISLIRVQKPGAVVWAGTLSLNGDVYWAYLIGVSHVLKVKPKPVVQKVRETEVEQKGFVRTACGPKPVSVEPSNIRRCRQGGGTMVMEKDENGCPTAPKCVKPETEADTTTAVAEEPVKPYETEITETVEVV